MQTKCRRCVKFKVNSILKFNHRVKTGNQILTQYKKEQDYKGK